MIRNLASTRLRLVMPGGWLLSSGYRLVGVACLLATTLSLPAAARGPIPQLDRFDPAFASWNGMHPVQTARKSCAEVYPTPEAAKHWTDCRSGQFSQCGGPDDCTCNDPDDRLVWYECKQGSYARCEDDHTCVDSCRY